MARGREGSRRNLRRCRAFNQCHAPQPTRLRRRWAKAPSSSRCSRRRWRRPPPSPRGDGQRVRHGGGTPTPSASAGRCPAAARVVAHMRFRLCTARRTARGSRCDGGLGWQQGSRRAPRGVGRVGRSFELPRRPAACCCAGSSASAGRVQPRPRTERRADERRAPPTAGSDLPGFSAGDVPAALTGAAALRVVRDHAGHPKKPSASSARIAGARRPSTCRSSPPASQSHPRARATRAASAPSRPGSGRPAGGAAARGSRRRTQATAAWAGSAYRREAVVAGCTRGTLQLVCRPGSARRTATSRAHPRRRHERALDEPGGGERLGHPRLLKNVGATLEVDVELRCPRGYAGPARRASASSSGVAPAIPAVVVCRSRSGLPSGSPASAGRTSNSTGVHARKRGQRRTPPACSASAPAPLWPTRLSAGTRGTST